MQQVKGNLFDFVGQHAAGVDGGVDESAKGTAC
jgi:hypothetical protein